MKKQFVSFISPVFNVNNYLDEFITSFRNVPSDQYELIIIDDRGSEDPYEVIKKYENIFPIKFIKNKKNLGLGFARNEGLKHIDKKATHVMYIDSDDKISNPTFMSKIQFGKITWFNNMVFDQKNEKYEDKTSSLGKNLFTNTIWGVAIPVDIAKELTFESRYFEDMIVNRRLIAKYKKLIITSKIPAVAYRYRGSGINSSKPNAVKFTAFVGEMNKMLAEKHNTYRFNIQEIYQYYWMWKPHLKGFDKTLLPKTKIRYKIAFWFTGSMIRWLHLEGLIYGRNKKNAFD